MTSNLPNKGEDVEVYHMKLWYDAVVLRSRPIKGHRGPHMLGPKFEAFVHFQGWSKRQDSWVHCSRVRPRMIGTDPSGASWIRDSVSKSAIKPGLLIEVRMYPQWLPAEILGPAAEGSFKAKLATDGSELTVTPDEIIKRWPIPGHKPAPPVVAIPEPIPEPIPRDIGTVGQRLKMRYVTGEVEEWFGGKVQALTGAEGAGSAFDITFDDGSFESSVNITDPDLVMEWPDVPPPAAAAADAAAAAAAAAAPDGSSAAASMEIDDDEEDPFAAAETRRPVLDGPDSGKKRKKGGGGGVDEAEKPKLPPQSKDVFCICHKKTDPNRRWLGCCQCLEWYHPECLQITYMTPPQWTCSACQGSSNQATAGDGAARLADVPDESGVIIRRAFEKVVATDSDLGEGDRYCVCRRSYSATETAGPQNFLQCELCAEWFHFECLGVSDEDVEKIDRFMCPKCTSMDAVLRGTASALAITNGDTEPAYPTDHEYYISCTAEVFDASTFETMEMCLICCGTGKPSDFIFCVQCGESFHKSCLNASLESRKNYDKIAARWRCLSCMRCSACEGGGDDNLVVCDICDRGFHLPCIKPKLDEIPEGTWLCVDCVQCLSCGSNDPGKNKTDSWHENYTLCTPCWKLHQKKQFCPVCQKVWDDNTKERMIGCDKCEMWVHTACDGIDDESYQRLELSGASYFCFQCREGKGSKRKDIQEFKNSMQFLRQEKQVKFRAAADLTISQGKDKPAQATTKKKKKSIGLDDPVPEVVDNGMNPPEVSAGTIDEPATVSMKTIRGMIGLPTEDELRTWTTERQKEFWFQRRRYWEKEKLRICQRACEASNLWAGGEKKAIVTRLARSEFFAGLMPYDYLAYDPNAADIVIPVPKMTKTEIAPQPAGAWVGGAANTFATTQPAAAAQTYAPNSSAPTLTPSMPEHAGAPPRAMSSPSLTSSSLSTPSRMVQPAADAADDAAAPRSGMSSPSLSNNGPTETTTSQPAAVAPTSSDFGFSIPQLDGADDGGDSATNSISTLQALLEMSQSPVPQLSPTSYNGGAGPSTMSSDHAAMAPAVSQAAAAPVSQLRYAEAPNPYATAFAPAAAPTIDPAPARALPPSVPVCIIFFVQMVGKDKPIKVKAPVTATILTIKEALYVGTEQRAHIHGQESCKIPPEKQRILFGGGSLADSGTLSSCGVEDNTTVGLDIVMSEEDEEEDGVVTSSDEDLGPGSDEDEEHFRHCVLCHAAGDLRDQGRLLPAGEDTWVHTNCALWSSECYEDEEGRLHEVHRALSRGKSITCEHCGENGATVGCCTSSCHASFHFKCALRLRCLMLMDKNVFCTKHKRKAKITAGAMHTSRARRNFTVKRKIFIPKPAFVGKSDTKSGAAAVSASEDSALGRLVGSFALHRPGKVVFDCPGFHSEQSLYPADYVAVRRFWSTTQAGERCPWRLQISRARGGQYPVFKATCSASGNSYFGVTPDAVWVQVLAAVTDKTSGRGSGRSISAAEFFGFTKACVREIFERLPDAGGCRSYQFITIPRSDAHTPKANDSGCARTEASTKVFGSAESKAGLGGHSKAVKLEKNTDHTMEPPDADTDKHDQRGPRGGGGTVNMLPDSMQYRQMRASVKDRTYVKNSPIHSLGLFADDRYSTGEMVIEYTGAYRIVPFCL